MTKTNTRWNRWNRWNRWTPWNPWNAALGHTGLLILVLTAPTACGGGGGGGDDVFDGGTNGNVNSTTCGNGEVESTEDCDDGANNSDTMADACRTDCTFARCGDSVRDTGESCDDGADNSDTAPNACREHCATPRCGDSVVDPGTGELCDDGNTEAGDGCNDLCTPEYCGNANVDPGEVCDDGNFDVGDNCSPDCLSDETCGNGRLDVITGETCDCGRDAATRPGACGAINGAPASPCTVDCQTRYCGNNVLDPGEVCDDGNSLPGDGCAPDCLTTEECGDGRLDLEQGEWCDCGTDPANLPPNCTTVNGGGGTCSANCHTVYCGNGVVDTAVGEVCDDGNLTAGDGCSPNCRSDETCGNGIVDAVNDEQCDDGAQNSGAPNAHCRPGCTAQLCGDGVVDDQYMEQCDDQNPIPGDGCSGVCGVEPHWICTGDPSGCVCEDRFFGHDCSQCAVLVDANNSNPNGDGRSWATAYQSIKSGVTAAAQMGVDCDVWVAQGTYYVGGSIYDRLSLRSNVSVLGGFAGGETSRQERNWVTNVTTLHPGASASAPAPALRTVDAIWVSNAVLDGLVIVGGHENQLYINELNRHGTGAVLYAEQATVTVRNCQLIDGQATSFGGAIRGYLANITLENTIVTNNRCTTVVGSGNAISTQGGTLTLLHATIADNTGSGNAGLHLHDTTATITNSILWNNGGSSIWVSSGSGPTVRYSDVQGGYAGTGNINTDPLFEGASYELSSTSPCIDVADDANTLPTDYRYAPRHDIAGVGTPSTLADMGALEKDSTPIQDHCPAPVVITCGDTFPGNTLGAPANITSYGCSTRNQTGPEVSYLFEPTAAAQVTVTVTGMTADLDLYVLGSYASGECDADDQCLDHSATSADETVTFSATAGSQYYFLVDGYNGASDGYTLSISCN